MAEIKPMEIAVEDVIAKIMISVPKKFTRNALAYNALDAHSRELAKNTFVTVGGKLLPCLSFREKDSGTLMLEVEKGFFEIVQRES